MKLLTIMNEQPVMTMKFRADLCIYFYIKPRSSLQKILFVHEHLLLLTNHERLNYLCTYKFFKNSYEKKVVHAQFRCPALYIEYDKRRGT